MIDTHCHLTFPDFAPDRTPGGIPAVLARAAAQGVSGVITIATTTTNAEDCLAVAHTHERVWCTAGVHPLYSDEGPHDWARLERVARDPKCVAFGELGLDNHYPEPMAARQREVLMEQLAVIAALSRGGVAKPIVIHCREAFADLLPILRESALDPTRMVFHCFTGTIDDARAVLDFGALISFTGVITYKNAPSVRAAAALAPLDRIMVETDAPFLSPDPHRSTRPCEPWMTRITLEALAAARAMPVAALHDAVNATTARFFGIDAR